MIGAEGFPYHTLLVNLAGCFLLAAVVKYLTTIPTLSRNLITGIGTGFLGSFTTFSTFSTEVCLMAAAGDGFTAACYIAVSMAGGFLAAALGFLLSDRMIRRKRLNENGG
jgi:CrcB protein